MADLKVEIPSIESSFYSNTAANLNKKKVVDVIRPKYGRIIDKISKISNVPSVLIESFMFIESGGNEKAETKWAIGLMQVGTSTASDVIFKEKGAGRLSDNEAEIIKKYLGKEKWKMIESVKPNQKSLGKTFVTRDELLNPEFNVLVGAMYLGQLIDEFTEKGKPRLDKAVVVYNRGRFDSISKKVIPFKGTTEEIKNIVPYGTYSYIEKLLGKNSLLEVLI